MQVALASPQQLAPTPVPESPVRGESVAELVGQMGCGCLLWLGLAALALGGGIIFPFALILLPPALIIGLIDLIRKIIKISKRRSQNY